MLRRLAGAITSLGGTAGVFGLVLTMNALDRGPPEPPEKAAVAFDTPPPPDKPKAKKRKPPPQKRTPPKAPPPPTPMVATAVGGLDLGLFGGSAIDLSDAAAGLVGDASDVVMSADAVDDLPVPVARSAPAYPAAARAKGVTGVVTLSIEVDARGGVADVRVLSASPPGTFDDAAVRAVRSWRFQPATYQGTPVAVRVEQTLKFDLERK